VIVGESEHVAPFEVGSGVAEVFGDEGAGVELRGLLASGDDYASAGKPQIDWEDGAAREALIDSRARDGFGLVLALQGRELDPPVLEAACLLVRVLGQDLEERPDGVFAIAFGVAPDRVISTVDVDTRHGHKTTAHGFDGYKGHVAVDPDSELVTATTVTAGNHGDATVAEALIADLVDPAAIAARNSEQAGGEQVGVGRPVAYGDNSYGTGQLQSLLDDAGIESRFKTPSPVAAGGVSPRTVSPSTSTVTPSPARRVSL